MNSACAAAAPLLGKAMWPSGGAGGSDAALKGCATARTATTAPIAVTQAFKAVERRPQSTVDSNCLLSTVNCQLLRVRS